MTARSGLAGTVGATRVVAYQHRYASHRVHLRNGCYSCGVGHSVLDLRDPIALRHPVSITGGNLISDLILSNQTDRIVTGSNTSNAIQCHPILFSLPFCSILLCLVLFCSVMVCSASVFWSVLFYSLLQTILFCCILLYFNRIYSFISN